MRFIIDMSTPKQTLFFRKFYRELTKGHKVRLVSRYLWETTRLQDYYKLPTLQCGRQSIGSKEEKLQYGLDRMQQLFKVFAGFKPDALITLCNPESIHVAYRLGVPVYNFCDIPESVHACRLTLPLSRKVFTPFVVPNRLISKYGVSDDKIISYNALDPCLYMPRKPNPKALCDYGVDVNDKFIVFREAETKASYYKDKPLHVGDVINGLSKKQHPLPRLIYLPHYDSHKIGDLQSLLAYAQVFVGGGGTMNIESCWWGTWTISTRKMLTCYDQWLVKNGLMTHCTDVDSVVDLCQEMFGRQHKNPNAYKLRKLKFPLKQIIDIILEDLGEYKR